MKHYTDEDLIDYLHGELHDAMDVCVHAHLAQCVDCRKRCDAQASFGDLLRGSALAAQREFPATIKAHVWAAIRIDEPTLLQRIRAVVSPVLAVPLAIGAALLLYLGVPVLRGPSATGTPSVSALYYLEEHAAQGQENPLADRVSTSVTLADQPAATVASAALIGAADARTLNDVDAARQ